MPNWGHALSRRRFLRSAAGAAGLVLGSSLWPQARADDSFDPTPIPGGNYFLGFPGPLFHVFAPGLGSFPVNQEPITITNFNGFVGLAYISGMATETNLSTGAKRRLPFLNSDMRFMKGVFRDTNGQVRQGTFALVWVDVFDPSMGGAQIHDFNPGIKPDGLFWTLALPDDSVEVHLGKGFASMEGTHVSVNDYHDFGNAIAGGGPGIPGPHTPAHVSFRVEWHGVNSRANVRNTDSPLNGGGFAGEFVRNTAQMAWSATVGNLKFVSDPLATSSSVFAEIGHERNGVFFAEGGEDGGDGGEGPK